VTARHESVAIRQRAGPLALLAGHAGGMGRQSPGERAHGADRAAPVHVDPLVAGEGARLAAPGQVVHVHPLPRAEICAQIASQQKGVVSRTQLLRARLSRHVIDALIEQGFLHPIHRGVYAVGHTALPQFGREQAALLACGEPSLVSDWSAVHLWEMIKAAPPEVHITAVGHHCRRRAGIHLHLTAAMDQRDIRVRHGLPVTSPSRSLIDFAATAPAIELDDAVAEGRAMRLVRPGELESALDRAGRTVGAARMRSFLREEDGPGITRSRAERRFRRYLRKAQLPQPKSNVWIGRHNVDFLWEEEKVIVEVDSWKFHGHRRAFERDRRKDMALRDAGYVVIRVTWRQFTEELLALIAHIARALDRRRPPEPH
jgi:very-short-patch-repair endonuclease